MPIITTRRISQIFFAALFLWFCITTTLGDRWWQLRGWPVNWILQLDPLIGLGTLLATGTLYAGLLWGLATLVATVFLGRFFCGWICPFGAMQQAVGYLGQRGLPVAAKIQRNQPHWAQKFKYLILLFMLAAASPGLLGLVWQAAGDTALLFWIAVAAAIVVLAGLTKWRIIRLRRDIAISGAVVLAAGVASNLLWPGQRWIAASLQIGLLDPIAMLYRSVNLALLPWIDGPLGITAITPRYYAVAGWIGVLFLIFLLLSLRIPRFYCRFICPLGALLGLLGRWSLWRIGKKHSPCSNCRDCEAHCEGACTPNDAIKINECVLCLNCMTTCPDQTMGYHTRRSAEGEQVNPDLARRQVIVSMAAGLAVVPLLRVGGTLTGAWDPRLIRPPGALAEMDFLTRCIKCGQCMRICPTNVIHPAGWQAGVEGWWTPMLNFRLGSSGCRSNCVACGQICPTAAIQPLTVAQRSGRQPNGLSGPIRLGTAFVDRGRCLPWAMDTPCIVCQENCPVSPKAIFTRTLFQPLRDGSFTTALVKGNTLTIKDRTLIPDQYAGGDYFCQLAGEITLPVKANGETTITLGGQDGVDLPSGAQLRLMIRLQQPHVDIRHCIGCGVCEHECPVHGRRAIRVTAENETRHSQRRLLLS